MPSTDRLRFALCRSAMIVVLAGCATTETSSISSVAPPDAVVADPPTVPRLFAPGVVSTDLRERDAVIERVMAVKRRYPDRVKSNLGALALMKSENALGVTGVAGETCGLRQMLPLYMGEGGNFERTFCCYGNNVDCSRCGAYAVFNGAYHRREGIALEE